ncbi:4-alpha-glucanotransferase [Lacibacter sp.]|uniref:4-alpha-glucanotransferase n=1 Tax=Lacibacter sp. TaxID=1915409 RepID=UPI002B4B0E97|nr:4-alpha-glucanotransferase [Lacibacter sp.]HLP36515.1 4-alpha-glucanotransferase [Lacibacter sp.]
MKIQFYLRFFTQYGQSLFVSGNCEALGNNDPATALPMQYLTDEFWTVSIDLGKDFENELQYNYILKNDHGGDVVEWGNDRVVEVMKLGVDELTLIDTWNHAGEFENAFYTQPFQNVLLPKHKEAKSRSFKAVTHVFKVKAPLLKEDEVLFISGSNDTLSKWSTTEPVLMHMEDNWWTARLNFSTESFPVAYKYGVFNLKTKSFVSFESGNNRILYDSYGRKKITILHDGFALLPNNTWKGTGVAIPVFSLRTQKSLGVGEFTDIKALVDWSKKVNMKLIQILPINDTTATHTWMDSYPYAAISAFALHPIYLNIEAVAGNANHPVVKSLKKKQKELNGLVDIDYEAVMKVKWASVKELYAEQKKAMHEDALFFEFFELNRHWLVPYAAFSYLRDKYKTPDFSQWKSHSVYDEHAIQEFVDPTKKHYDEIALYYFIQYHLHLQLQSATAYAHANGIVVKGDIPIGIYRNSCDAWVEPELYNMSMQAGAPPDDFAVKGQNWGFPTYNWQRMAQDDFKWWRQRFEQMSNYFDAFRIDHILGFFRIWSIPMHAVEGILGYFVPATPIHINEFGSRGLQFDYQRFCRPFINDDVLRELMNGDTEVLKPYLNHMGNGQFELKEEFNTQRKVEAHFAKLEASDHNDWIKHGLYDCISNVIFFEVEGSQSQQFHFRISMSSTSSFRYLDAATKNNLDDLYVNYFYRRQDDFWRKEAMAKLPYLKRSTNMLVCGEDLGMVPDCVPDVMNQLGMLSLEIQRMPKDPSKQFFHPSTAPYLSVVTPSTHDMSTIRGWWEEDRMLTQKFYTHELGQFGEAPYYCEPWIVQKIISQHLQSPAMWSVFQIQELLGMSGELRRENPHDERINVPANPKNYWRYRMHINLEDLLHEEKFNEELKELVVMSGRG